MARVNTETLDLGPRACGLGRTYVEELRPEARSARPEAPRAREEGNGGF